MSVQQAVLAVIGFSSGIIASGGLFSFIVELGVIADFADRTHTADKILLYEDCAALGGIAGTVFSLYPAAVPFGAAILPVFGVFSGIFVGCWAMALAEILNIFPIFTRRLKFVKRFWIIIVSVAFGKGIGALIALLNRW